MNKLDNKKLMSLVEYKLKDTLFNLMYDIIVSPLDEIDNAPEFLKELENEIKELYVKLIDCFDRDTDSRDKFFEEYNALGEKIINKAVDVNRYTCVNNQLGEYILREMKLIEVGEIDESIPINNMAMAEKVSHYLTHINDDLEGKFKKGELISVLPLRMTKAKYRDYVKSAFAIMTDELPPEFAAASMNRLKDMCYCDFCQIGNDFPLMKESIEEIYKLPVSEFNKDNIEEYFNIIDDNIEYLQRVYACLGVMYYDITYFNILADFVIDEDYIFGDDFVLKDLYYSICNVIRDNDAALIDTITDNLNNEIEERYEASGSLEEEISKAIEEIEDISKEDSTTQLLINVNNTISSAHMTDIDYAIMMGGKNNKSNDELTDELCDYIENSVSELPIVRQKYIKQRFLQHIPCPMTDDEITDYAHYSFGGVNDRNILLMSFGDIFDITDKAEEEHHHDHEHHHHDHCGCGHHH